MRRTGRNWTAVFVLLSVLIHSTFVVVMAFGPPLPLPTQAKIEVEYVAPREVAPPKPDVVKKTEPKAQAQIVEQQKRLNDEKDERSRFLSAFDQKVIKQTRAANSGKFSNQAAGQARTAGAKAGEKRAVAQAQRPTPRLTGELPSLKDLMPKFAPDEGPTGTAAEQSGEASATDDYLKDVGVGMQTLLSTREFVYYSYYNRIKESLRQHWEPDVRERVKIIYRQGRSIASAKDRLTQVLVTLDMRGELIGVQVLTQSGVIDLDNAALQAFREAAPFPNPPKGMIENDGTVKIRWDFVLEV